MAVLRSVNLRWADLRAQLHAAKLRDSDLHEADLSRANLPAADLRGCDLTNARLRFVNFSDADLREANLSGADLRNAFLQGANLRGAELSVVDLRHADLRDVCLRGADLRGAHLYDAHLRGADLRDARLPAPTAVLLAAWGGVSDDLTADLILFDAACHPDPGAFDRWAAGGRCPYAEALVERAANFTERPHLWGRGQPRTPHDLMRRLLAEKCPEWAPAKLADFETRFKKSQADAEESGAPAPGQEPATAPGRQASSDVDVRWLPPPRRQ